MCEVGETSEFRIQGLCQSSKFGNVSAYFCRLNCLSSSTYPCIVSRFLIDINIYIYICIYCYAMLCYARTLHLFLELFVSASKVCLIFMLIYIVILTRIFLLCTHIHIHVHTLLHTRIHTHMQANVHAYARSHAYVYVDAYVDRGMDTEDRSK